MGDHLQALHNVGRVSHGYVITAHFLSFQAKYLHINGIPRVGEILENCF